MSRIRILAALTTAVAIAACADAPTAAAPAAPAAPLANSSACTSTVMGPTAVNSGSTYEYWLSYNSACMSPPTWTVYGGTITANNGGRIWVRPAETSCMQVDATTTVYHTGSSLTASLVATVDGHKPACSGLIA